MLIGRSGKFTLLSPFDTYGSTIVGKIVEVSYMHHMASRGRDVKALVYRPVNAESLYAEDYRNNLVVVTIQIANGTKYLIPDKYIPNLYNSNYIFVDAYLTVHLGELPMSYEFSHVRDRVASEITAATGVNVAAQDVYISVEDSGVYYDRGEADVKNRKRESNKTNNQSDFSKYVETAAELGIVSKKLSSLEKLVTDSGLLD